MIDGIGPAPHRLQMGKWLAVGARTGVVLGVLAATTGAKPPPLPDAEAASDVPRGKPPPLPSGQQVGSSHAPHAISSGTAFVVAVGRIVTNNHVVEGCGHMVARNAAGVEQPAPVLATDHTRDLALLSVPANFGPQLTFRSAPDVRRGETVVTYGFPLFGLLSNGPTLTTGAVSALSGLRDNQLNYQISAPVQPGNSGGPLLDSSGNVVGIVVAKLNAARIAEMTDGDIPQNVNFAVKAGPVLDFLREQNVPVRTAKSDGVDKGAAAVGDIANPSTMFLQCFR